jgi:hypothetical protein
MIVCGGVEPKERLIAGAKVVQTTIDLYVRSGLISRKPSSTWSSAPGRVEWLPSPHSSCAVSQRVDLTVSHDGYHVSRVAWIRCPPARADLTGRPLS